MNSEAPGYEMTFTDEQLQYIEQLSGIGFLPRKIAITVGIPARMRNQFITEMETEGTILNHHYLKGQYKTEAEARLNVAKSSKSSIMAFQEMKKTQQESEIDELKRTLEAGYETPTEPERALMVEYEDSLDSYNALKEFVAIGKSDNLPGHLQHYWNKLSTAHDLVTNFSHKARGRKHIVKILRMKYPEVTERHGHKLVNEAISFFNVDIEKSHWRNILCESLDKAIAVAWKMNRIDWMIKAIKEQAVIQGLHLAEPDPIPEELLSKKVIVISSNAKELGYEPGNRKDLLEKIRSYEISKNHKKKLANDAGITDIEFEE
jgi:hypothetical protein